MLLLFNEYYLLIINGNKMIITLPDGNKKEFPRGTTGMEVAKSISEGLARNALGIFVNNEKYDLSRPIQEDAEVRIVTFNDDEGKDIYWHSSAHLMAEAIEELYPGVKFGIGPSIEHGFYYDVDLPEDKKITDEDLPKIEAKMKELAKNKSDYQRIEMSWDDAMSHYKKIGDEYKVELLEDLKEKGEDITFYKQGNFVDLCRGTHVPNTGTIKAVKLLSVAGAYWRGDSDRKMLTRIYGITFPKKKMLDEHLEFLEEARKRDHRKIGKDLELFQIMPTVGVGLPVWLPKGALLRRKVEELMRQENLKRGYVEVITPVLGNLNMYRTSGHYPYYKESQFPPLTIEDEQYLLRPMNCPHHHQIYLTRPRSYRELPLRLFEFGHVHRYEQSGELSGLSRVRSFTQDDAHIYCTDEQLKDEVKDCIQFIKDVAKTYNLDDGISVELSFRDDNEDKYGGNIELWEQAQDKLLEAAKEMDLDYIVSPGEAAFYGPKVDFILKDAIGRKWQLGTVQVDYVMPQRFEMDYIGSDNAPHRIVIIHRAILGSLERFMSILIEHFAGNFPFWLAPVQIMVMPIGEKQIDYAEKLHQKFKNAGYRVDTDYRSEKVNRKIAEAEQQKIPFGIIVGQKEMDSETASVRQHTKGDLGVKSIDELMELFERLNVPGVKE